MDTQFVVCDAEQNFLTAHIMYYNDDTMDAEGAISFETVQVPSYTSLGHDLTESKDTITEKILAKEKEELLPKLLSEIITLFEAKSSNTSTKGIQRTERNLDEDIRIGVSMKDNDYIWSYAVSKYRGHSEDFLLYVLQNNRNIQCSTELNANRCILVIVSGREACQLCIHRVEEMQNLLDGRIQCRVLFISYKNQTQTNVKETRDDNYDWEEVIDLFEHFGPGSRPCVHYHRPDYQAAKSRLFRSENLVTGKSISIGKTDLHFTCKIFLCI